ncbi:MAG: hypothetical protein MHM6MM_006291 [Cercozoa sp. M6MM]
MSEYETVGPQWMSCTFYNCARTVICVAVGCSAPRRCRDRHFEPSQGAQCDGSAYVGRARCCFRCLIAGVDSARHCAVLPALGRKVVSDLSPSARKPSSLGGESRHFSAGLDLRDFMEVFAGDQSQDAGRKAVALRQRISQMQQNITAAENCRVPVIACVHGGVIGGAIDLITACDIRIASSDAFFSVKEVDIGMAADVGTLQRLPKVVRSDSWVRDVCLTGRRFDAQEALQQGITSLRGQESSCRSSLGTGLDDRQEVAHRCCWHQASAELLALPYYPGGTALHTGLEHVDAAVRGSRHGCHGLPITTGAAFCCSLN